MIFGNSKFNFALNQLSYTEFERFLVSSSIVIKFLTTSKVKNPNYSTIIFALLSPFGVRKIEYSQVTLALPYFTHAMVHKSSMLLKFMTISEISDVYIADIEAQFLIIPIEALAISLAKEIVNCLRSMLQLRRISQKNNETCNDYGEIYMLKFLNAHIDGNPYTLHTYMTGSKHLTEEKKQYRINIKKLKQIYSVAEGDAKAKAFVKDQNYKEIAYLERAIAKYEERAVTQDENLIEEILEKHLHKLSPQGDLTNIARQALFTQAQILINESEIEADINTKVESI